MTGWCFVLNTKMGSTTRPVGGSPFPMDFSTQNARQLIREDPVRSGFSQRLVRLFPGGCSGRFPNGQAEGQPCSPAPVNQRLADHPLFGSKYGWKSVPWFPMRKRNELRNIAITWCIFFDCWWFIQANMFLDVLFWTSIIKLWLHSNPTFTSHKGHVKIRTFLEVSLTVGPTHHWSLLGFRHWDGNSNVRSPHAGWEDWDFEWDDSLVRLLGWHIYIYTYYIYILVKFSMTYCGWLRNALRQGSLFSGFRHETLHIMGLSSGILPESTSLNPTWLKIVFNEKWKKHNFFRMVPLEMI